MNECKSGTTTVDLMTKLSSSTTTEVDTLLNFKDHEKEKQHNQQIQKESKHQLVS